MAASAQQIVNEIVDYMDKHGGNYRNWYVGIASNPRDRLFSDHNVNEHSDLWIFNETNDEDTARRIEKHFIDNVGTQGGGGGGSSSTRSVYAYRIAAHTNE